MAPLSNQNILTLSRTIGEIYTAREIELFYHATLDAIQGIIPCELRSCADINPDHPFFANEITGTQEHGNISGKHLPALNAHLHEHPLFPHCFSNNVVKTTDYVSSLQFKKTAIYHEYYRHLDVETQISFSIPTAQNRVALFTLSRNKPDFSEDERLVLTLLRPHLISALRNVMELDHIHREKQLMHKSAEMASQGAILFQSDWAILFISPFAQEMLEKYFDTTCQVNTLLPRELLNRFKTATHHHVTNRGISKGFPQMAAGEDITVTRGDTYLKIRLLYDCGSGTYSLFINESDTNTTLQNLQKYGLSNRETEVLQWLSRGKTNMEIAMILNMSKRTAEKHLENIFSKLGVATRAAAVSLVR